MIAITFNRITILMAIILINLSISSCSEKSLKSEVFSPRTHSSVDSFNLQNDYLIYHTIKKDKQGKIMPWFSENKGESYSHVIHLAWNFWDTMRIDKNGLPYYMNHQIWEEKFDDGRGIAGSQFEMALSSWYLYYLYTGNQKVFDNMLFIADYYLSHSLSSKDDEWANIPYPYNTLVYSGFYDGDMILGKDFTQPDKAGSFANELVNLYMMCGNERYLNAAIAIANTLAKHTEKGDIEHSPLPFKVNAVDGTIGMLIENVNGVKQSKISHYSSNWSGTLALFQKLERLKKGNVTAYQASFDTILQWMKSYPLKNNKWGPFFEDVYGWSDAQINAITFARFMMDNRTLFPNWKSEVKGIFDWVYQTLGNKKWEKYGVMVVNEQTAYEVEGNSHTARQAATELLYSRLAKDSSRVENAERQLNWATYSMDFDGKNQYPNEQIWMSDGYGDYVQHFIRAMASSPKLAPSNENHLLSSTSTIRKIEYYPDYKYGIWGIAFSEHELTNNKTEFPRIRYFTFDKNSSEELRLVKKPTSVLVNNKTITENTNPLIEGWVWEASNLGGGLLKIKHQDGDEIKIIY